MEQTLREREQVAVGDRITARDLKARYAYNEFSSDRWRSLYADSAPEKVRIGIPFDALRDDERAHLAWMLSNVRAIMPPEIDRYPFYECEAWSQDQVRRLHTIADLGPDHKTNVSITQFAVTAPTDDPGDPRRHAALVPSDAPFEQTEPIIAVDYGAVPIILEGCKRCLLFLRSRDPSARMLVWRPRTAPQDLSEAKPTTIERRSSALEGPLMTLAKKASRTKAKRKTTGKTLCLNMIVKNEMANIERCLAAVAPHIACWVIGDTGSTDGTQDFIRDFFAARGIPGELHEFPFVDFGQARNEALACARASKLTFDYLLFTDADMELVVEEPKFAEQLTDTAYRVVQRASGLSYWNTRLLKRDGESAYKGVTHEFVDVKEGGTGDLVGLYYIDHATGSNRGEKVERDVRLLKQAIGQETDRGMVARYTFYLANTLKDGGRREEAIEAYTQRAEYGGWMEEVFISLWNIGRLKEELDRPVEEVLAAYDKAAEAAPWRAEALHSAARFCRFKGLYARGCEYAKRGLTVPYPADSLFVYDWVYDYGLLDELAVNAYWSGAYQESLDVCDRLLAEGKLPADQLERIEKNKAYAEQKLAEAAEPAQESSDPYSALLRAAQAKEASAEPDEVVAAYMEAVAARPDRAEALHDAARFCRGKGLNDRAYEPAARGLTIPKPAPEPGLQDWIYDWGLQQEISIAANYSPNPTIKELGFAACDWLALNRAVPPSARGLAISNLHFYIGAAAALMPSFSARTVDFTPPQGFRPNNPSVARRGDEIIVLQRTVNYVIDYSAGENDPKRYGAPDGSPVRTRNFLLHLDSELNTVSSSEVPPPADLPPPAWRAAPRGFEDMRLFAWREGLWVTASTRELSSGGWCEEILARIVEDQPDGAHIAEWRILTPEGRRRHEKNWMPVVDGDALKLVRHCDPAEILDDQARMLIEEPAPIQADQFRGGSQLVAFDGGWLALIHDVRLRDGQRQYRHRFVWFDQALHLQGVSRPFYFEQRGIEFAAGLAWHPDRRRLIVSYGVGDEASRLATVEGDDIRRIVQDATRLPSGAPTANGRPRAIQRSFDVPLVFVHASWRTSSTWFFSKFRSAVDTTSFYEPFNEDLLTLTLAKATSDGPQSWDSRHPQGRPYYLEYAPFVAEAGGVRAFKRQIPYVWYLPEAGLIEGDLRREEVEYLNQLVDHAALVGELPVFADNRSLGRLRAIKRAVGGFHIFLHRNLWKQWLSYISYRRQKAPYFYNTVINILLRGVDPFLEYLCRFYVEGEITPGDRTSMLRPLEALPETAMFGAFMGLHIYLHLNAQMSADLTVDATRLAHDAAYRTAIEDDIRRKVGISISLDDATDPPAPDELDIDAAAIDWPAIRAHANVAVETLAKTYDAAQLRALADSWLDAAETEARAYAAARPAPPAPPAPEPSPELIPEDPEWSPTQRRFRQLAPFLAAADSPRERLEQSRAFDARIAPFLDVRTDAALPQIHTFFEVLSETAPLEGLASAIASQRAAGHPVKLWSYTPERLESLRPLGVELADAADVVPRAIYDHIMTRAEIRYFSDVFRYAVLYEHGGLWLDSDIVMLRPFPFRGDYFFNLQWHCGSGGDHWICGNAMYAKPFSSHLRRLYERALRAYDSMEKWVFGDVGPRLLSEYIASDQGAELQNWVFSPAFFNPIDWIAAETDAFRQPIGELADYLGDERVIGVHLWTAKHDPSAHDSDHSHLAALGRALEDARTSSNSPTASTPTRTAIPATGTATHASTIACSPAVGCRCGT